MKAKDMISPEIPLLTPGMSVKQGLATMQMSGLSSLPIVDEGSYVGVVHEKELLRDDVAGKIGRENWRTPSVREESHLFDVVNQLAQYSDDICAKPLLRERLLNWRFREKIIRLPS